MDNDQLRERASRAMEAAYRIREADTEREMFDRVHYVRDAVDSMIDAARAGEPGPVDYSFRRGRPLGLRSE